MYPTVEVRWFLRGEIPSEIWRWFHNRGHDPETQPPREDFYLLLANGGSLGVKLREGRIEIKQRNGRSEIVRFGQHTLGRVEQWIKWSFVASETDNFLARISEFSKWWIGVRKERKLRTYQVLESGTVTGVSTGIFIENGCGWELASVNYLGAEDPWWSLGFEAFGKENNLRDTLSLVADSILSVENAPVLTVEDSFGYPRWLQIVGDRRI
jgi:hypothetical protein